MRLNFLRSLTRRLLKKEASPQECDEYGRESDAGSANSSAIGATEDTLSLRSVRSGGRSFLLQQPEKEDECSYRFVALHTR
jgi:hypothetical protein